MQFLGKDQATILTAQADRLATLLIDLSHDLLVDFAHKNHLNDIHGGFIRHPHAIYKVRRNPHFLQDRSDLRTAAMDHHRMQAYKFHQGDITGKVLLETLINHGVPAVFDNDSLSVETTDIRKGLNEYVGNSGGHWSFVICHWLFAMLAPAPCSMLCAPCSALHALCPTL